MNSDQSSKQEASQLHSVDRGISPVADGIGRRHWIGIASFLMVMAVIGAWCFHHGHSRRAVASTPSRPPRAAVSSVKPSWLAAAFSTVAPEPLQVPPLPPAPISSTSAGIAEPGSVAPTPAVREREARQHSPILIVNLASAPSAGNPPAVAAPTPASAGPGADPLDASSEHATPTPAEGYADRIRHFAHQSANEAVPSASAQSLDLDWRIAQGKLIHATLETAMQSDLPGPLRAVVSESVFSENGGHLLIRPGSRLIGEYRAGLAMGATRVFVIWKRLLEPDGVSVALGSQGTDALGRAGLSGTVDRHFLERFSTATLLSLIGSSTTAVQGNNSVVVNTAQGFGQVAQSAFQDLENLPPTVYVDQGTPILVVVQRDLDFSLLSAALP